MSEKEQNRDLNINDATPPDYKLLIDPQIRRGEEKLVRYGGEAYNTENHGQGVVIIRDPRPRMNRLWSRRERCDLPVPRYKVDEWYIGAVPPREITFSKLNDNVTKQFMENMCSKFGKLERVRVYHHPKTQKHMGLSKVVFSSMKSAAECVKQLHNTSVMGNVVHAQIDSKGELLNKLFQRIARGEMVAETVPDVIRHTQDGISMSNKFKERGHHRRPSKDGSRRSSQDDPRKLRKSIDESDRHAASRRHHRKDSIKEVDETNGNSAPPVKKEENVADAYDSAGVETTKHFINSDRDESHSEVEHEPVDLESRISSLLQEDVHLNMRESAIVPDRHQERLKSESSDNVIDIAPHNVSTFSEEQREPLELDRRKLPHANSTSDLPMERYNHGDRVRYEHGGSREHSPHYRHNHHDSRSDDPKIHHYHRSEYDRNREPPPGSRYYDRHGYERGFYHGNCESRENDFIPRRSEHRRIYSPPRGAYRHSNHLPSRYRQPSPERFNHHRYTPPRNRTDRYGGSRTGSPEPWRRSPGYHPDSDTRHMDRRRRSHHGRSPSPPVLPSREMETHRSTPRGVDSGKMSLDQRLKEMTGETSNRGKKKKKDQTKEQQIDNESSVDMEISEGESDHEKQGVRQQEVDYENINMNHDPNSVVVGHEHWNTRAPPWNGQDVQTMDTRVWNMAQREYHKGFDRNPQLSGHYQMSYPSETWPNHFHSAVMPPGIMPPQFSYIPTESYPMMPPMMNNEAQHFGKDENLCQCILAVIVEDLKATVSRDLNRKVVETMAFKVYESWWDENANAMAASKPASTGLVGDKLSVINEKTESTANNDVPTDNKPDNKLKSQSLLNAFDPLNWAKNSFEMDGFRIGLGLRSAVSKMPSFRVKKRPRIPSPVKDEEGEDMTLSKKARLAIGKENQERNISTKKKRQRITVLDSEGEDELSEDDSYADSASDDETNIKSSVLNVDEVFSESSESSEDLPSDESEKSSEDEEESSESESENEAAPQADDVPRVEDKMAVSIPTDDEPNHLPAEKKLQEAEKPEEPKAEAKSISDFTSESRVSTESDTISTVEDSNISSLLSPTALGITPNAITPQQLRHVHPKKRHRLISHDQYEPFAKIAATTDHDKLKDDLSLITEKERCVLEALTDMHKTPERRITTDSDISVTSLPDKIVSPPPSRENFHDPLSSSPQNELDAAQALLSFREAGPLKPVIPKMPTIQLKYKNLVTLSESTLVAALAEEHNYFLPCNTRRTLPSSDPIVAHIVEEHNYSRIIWEEAGSDHERPPTPLSESTLSAESIYNFKDEIPEIVTPAERVKLRREKPKKLQKAVKVKKKKTPAAVIPFSPRNKMEDLVLAYEMWCSGLDLEDMKYLRKVYENHLEDPSAPTWVNDSHWVPHTVTAAVTPKKSKSKRRRKDRNADDNLELHKTGSARTEGYYKLEDMVKLQQRREMYGEGEPQSTTSLEMAKSASNGVPECGGSAPDKNLGARETRHFMRRIAAEVGSDAGDLFKYNQLMFRKKAVKFKRSSIHGWGLFAQEPIGADEMVIEYVGQVVRTLIAERREVNYTELGIGSSYLFRIDTEHIIDATKSGNYARFMNHSCNPSCYAKVITVDTAKKIVIYSKGPIKKSEEITYDYKFPLEDDKVMCFCGAENCRRTLN